MERVSFHLLAPTNATPVQRKTDLEWIRAATTRVVAVATTKFFQESKFLGR
ncbi:MAG: hypothetical protein QXG67_00705 [Candidatus Nitrosotenuis sp.]